MASERIDSPNAPDPVGSYPHARKVGGWLFLSGVGPREKGNSAIPGVEFDNAGHVVGYDVTEQARSVFRNIETILRDAGYRWEDMVDITVFLTDMTADFKAFNQVYAEFFQEHRPSRTTIEVGGLPTPIAVELKVIAYTDRG